MLGDGTSPYIDNESNHGGRIADLERRLYNLQVKMQELEDKLNLIT
jgi:hypothetical protein